VNGDFLQKTDSCRGENSWTRQSRIRSCGATMGRNLDRKRSNRMGRPKVKSDVFKGVFINIRLSEAEKELLQKRANSEGIKLSKWVRKALLGHEK